MAVSPDVLKGPRLKVQRANRHIGEIISKTHPLSREWHSIGIEADTIPSYAQPSKFTLRYRPHQPIAELIALMIGDAIHNLRGALDHLATGIRRSTAWNCRGHFPMREKREDLIPNGEPISDLETIEVALPGSVHLLLDEIRPRGGGLEPLWTLHSLDDNDKHNLILPTVTIAMIMGLNISDFGIRNCGAGGNAAETIDLISADRPFTMDENFYTTVDVKFGSGTAFENDPVVPTLTQLSQMVSSTLDQFETLIRNS